MPEQSFQQPQRHTPNKHINNNNNNHKQHDHADSSNSANQRPEDQKQDDRHRHPPPGLRRNSYNSQNSNYRNNHRSGYHHQDQQMNRQPPINGPPTGVYYPHPQQQQPNIQYGQHVPDNSAVPYDQKGYDNSQPPYQGGYDAQRGTPMYQQQQPMEPSPPGYDDGHGNFPIHGPNEGLPQYGGGAGLLGSGYDAQVASMEQQNAMYRAQPSGYPQQQPYPPQNPAMYGGGQFIQGQYPPQNAAQYRPGPPPPPPQGMPMIPNQNVPQGYYPVQGGPMMMPQQYYVNVPVGLVCKAQQPGPPVNPSENDKNAGQAAIKQPPMRKDGNQQGPSDKAPESNLDQRNQQHPPPHLQGGNAPQMQQQPQMQFDQSAHPQAVVPNPLYRVFDHVQRVAPHQIAQAMPYNYGHPPQQQPPPPQQQMPEHMNPMQMQQMHGPYGPQVPAMMQQPMNMAPPMGHPQNQMPYPPNAQPPQQQQPQQQQQQFFGRGRPEPLMQGQYMHPSMANRSFNNGPPGMANQNTFPRGRGRGGGRGTWRGGNPDGRDNSFNHSRQNSGQSYDGSRSQYGHQSYNNRGNHFDQSHHPDMSHNMDDEIEGLTNRVELLQPVRGSRTGSPNKQVLQLIDEKKQEDDLSVATSGEVEFVIENQSVIVGTQVSVENARHPTPPSSKTENVQASEEETGVVRPDPEVARNSAMKCIRCVNHSEIALDDVYSHNLRHPNGDTWCPELQKVTCRECGATGDKAHDSQCCPTRNKNNQSENTKNEEDFYSRNNASHERGEENQRDRERDRDHDRTRDYPSYRKNSENHSYDGGRGGRNSGGDRHNTSHSSYRGSGGSRYRGGQSRGGGGSRGGGSGGREGGGGGSRNYDNRKH